MKLKLFVTNSYTELDILFIEIYIFFAVEMSNNIEECSPILRTSFSWAFSRGSVGNRSPFYVLGYTYKTKTSNLYFYLLSQYIYIFPVPNVFFDLFPFIACRCSIFSQTWQASIKSLRIACGNILKHPDRFLLSSIKREHRLIFVCLYFIFYFLLCLLHPKYRSKEKETDIIWIFFARKLSK